MLCNYGCGQEAKYQFKNGKWCCSETTNKCKSVREKSSSKKYGKKISEETKQKIRETITGKKHSLETKDKIRSSSTGRKHSEESKHKIRVSNTGRKHSEETKKKISTIAKNFIPWHKGTKGKFSIEYIRKLKESHTGKKHSEETKEKMSKSQIGRKHSEETKKKLSLKGKGRKGTPCSDKCKEINRQKLLNGHAAYMNKFIKNPSKPEVKLREIIKELYPSCEFQYKIFNYAIDVTIPECKIAIEYDGWYHFDCQEHIEYHKKRQREIEKEGWKFIKYNIFQRFPCREQIENDIRNLVEK